MDTLVELRTYADVRWRDRTFLDLLDHLHATEGVGLPRPVVESFLRADGRAVVIFDGLDELFDPQLRETVSHQIAGFAARYPRARIVVTSRVIGYWRAILDAAGFTHHMLQDLGPGQIAAFVTSWYQIACPHNPTEATRLRGRLLAAVEDSSAVRELAGNPMLLTILSITDRHCRLMVPLAIRGHSNRPPASAGQQGFATARTPVSVWAE
jgi:predicted NACHT family NTPase